MIRTVTKSYAQLAQENLDKQVRVDSLATLPVLSENPTPEDRYLAARANMERFSILQVWWDLYFAQLLLPIDYHPGNPLCGFGINPIDPANNSPTNKRSPHWRDLLIESSSKGVLKSFPPHLNLHLLNIIYYNSLASDFFRDLVNLNKSPQNTGNDLINADSLHIQGFNFFAPPPGRLLFNGEDTQEYYVPGDRGFVRGTLLGLGTLIRSLAIEPNGFPLILKVPSGDFIFFFVRNEYPKDVVNPVPELLTPEQQEGITKKDPIRSYIRAFNESGLKVLSYLSIKTCRKGDGTLYHVPTEMYSLDLTGYEYLKHSYVISMFTIALKLLGSITLPRMKRVEPHPFDSQLAESVRFLFNPRYISHYDRKNTAYLQDPTANPFTEYTFTSSPYWGTDKIRGEVNKSIPDFTFTDPTDSHPDLLGLGDISSTSPMNNEIPFIEISQWDITEGMKPENSMKCKNLKGSRGLIKFADYVGSTVVTPLLSDEGCGILVWDGSGNVTDRGFLFRGEYTLPPGVTLFKRLREVCSKQVTPTQKGTSAGGKYFTKGITPGIKPLSVTLRNIKIK